MRRLNIGKTLLAQHDTASAGVGYFTSIKEFILGLFRRRTGTATAGDSQYSLLSTSTWSSESDKEIKKRLILRRKSWGADGKASAKPEQKPDNLIILFLRFLIGVGLTQGFYLVLTYNSKWKPNKAAWWTGTIGFMVALGMAFSKMGLKALVQDGQNAVLSTMEDTIDTIIEAVETAQELYTEFAQKLRSLGRVIKRLNNYIRSMGNICSKKLGAFLCIIPNFVAKQAKKLITAPVKNAIARIKAEFQFNMTYSYEFKYDLNASKTVSDITNDIMTEIKGDLKFVTSAFGWLRFAMGFSMLVVILKAVKYRYKYLTVNTFDNFYITKNFIKLDRRRKRQGKVSVLPLRARENSLYVRPNSCWMSRREVKKLTKGMSMLTFSFLYTLGVIFVDYSFYWLLQKISTSLSLQEQAGSLLQQAMKEGAEKVANKLGVGEAGRVVATNLISLTVGGQGFVSVIYKSIASALERLASSEGYSFSMDKCLPNAKAPDYIVYAVIITLYILCYVICVTEAYVLRWRRSIMATFYPKRERVRVLFLRTKILAARGIGPDAGIKNALKKACLQAQKNAQSEEVSLADRLSGQSGIIGWAARKMSGRTAYRCHVCKLAGGLEHSGLFTSCQRFGCKGKYCVECFEDLHRLCLLCLMKHSSKVGKERRMSKTDLTSSKPNDRTKYSTEIEELIDSSGISDSSATSSDSDEESEGESDSSHATTSLMRSRRSEKGTKIKRNEQGVSRTSDRRRREQWSNETSSDDS